MSRLVITNVSIYRAIALEAHRKMHEHMNAGQRPKDDGSPGSIKTFDPEQNSFNQANAAERFQKCRKKLVHEKAHFDDEIMTAQDEADNAHQLLVAIDAFSMSQSS